TAWHCCLEFYSVSTRLPPEFRLTPLEAVQLLESEVFARMTVHDVRERDRREFLKAAAPDGIGGGPHYGGAIRGVGGGGGPRGGGGGRGHGHPPSFRERAQARAARRDAGGVSRRRETPRLARRRRRRVGQRDRLARPQWRVHRTPARVRCLFEAVPEREQLRLAERRSEK